MNKDKFIDFDKVVTILNKHMFFGFTAKREGKGRVTYTYKSIKWLDMLITIETLKLDPTKIPSRKIVLGIKVNEKQLDTFKDFVNLINNLYSIHLEKKKKNYGNGKKY